VVADANVSPLTIARINARIDRLTAPGVGRLVFALLGICYFWAFYDLSMTGFTLPVIIRDLHLTQLLTSLVVSLNLVGYMVGSYLLATIGDAFGRRRALQICMIILAGSALLSGLAWDAASLIAFRFLVGVGVGAQIALASSYLGELSPAQMRGRFVSYSALWGGVALAAAPFIALALVGVPHLGWRILFALGVLAALVLPFYQQRWLPESPRWLVLHRRTEDAERIVASMEQRARSVTGAELPPVPEEPSERPGQRFPTLELLRRPYVISLLVVFAYWFLNYFNTYAVVAYRPIVLQHFGFTLANSLQLIAISSISFVVSYLLNLLILDRVERKTWILLGAGLTACSYLVMALTRANPIAYILSTFIAGCVGNGALIVAGYIYTLEIFPTRARASAMGLADGLGHVGGVVQSFVVLYVLTAVGVVATVYLFAAVGAVMMLLILVMGRATTGRPLTELAGDARPGGEVAPTMGET